MSYFDIDPLLISELFDLYQHREFDEDLQRINSFDNDKGLNAIFQHIKTNLIQGLSENDDDFRERIEHFSSNKCFDDEEISFFSLILEAFGDFMIQILVIAAIVQIGIGLSPLAQSNTDWIDGMAIVFAIVVVVLTSAITNYNKEKKFQELKKINKAMFEVSCKRNGKVISISSENLMVGDVVKIEYGMIIPADGILIEGENILVDESSISGESNAVSKENIQKCNELSRNFINKVKKNHSLPSPLLISGTSINSGSGWFVVLAVGKYSVKGKIGELVINSAEINQSPLEIKLEDIANDIGMFGLLSAILTFVALTVKLIFYKYEQYNFHYEGNLQFNRSLENNSNSTDSNTTSTFDIEKLLSPYLKNPSIVFEGLPKEILSILMLCVTIIVVAIPEGLPLAVTLALSFSVRKMMQDNNLVRHLKACETMGGANYILSDKTGTLTENKMTVISYFDNEKVWNNPINNKETLSKEYSNILYDSLLLNIDIEVNEDDIQTSGSKTDYALYKFAKELKLDMKNIKSESKIVNKISFHSIRKRMSSLVLKNNKLIVLIKGAKEYILNSCTDYMLPNGSIHKMNNEHLEKVNVLINEYSEHTHRCIAIAYKNLSNEYNIQNFKEKINDDEYEIEQSGFTFLGVLAINDKLKENVAESVKICNKSGIKVLMITGDNKVTAVAFAKQCNIISGNSLTDDNVIVGQDFYTKIGGVICKSCNKSYDLCLCPTTSKLIEESNNSNSKDHIQMNIQDLGVGNMTTFSNVVNSLKVLARARPIDKFALVLGLKELDNVVAVTGDGSNDAQALSKADVGFAMGIQGTEIAKNASDIIILDDNFSSIVSSIKWGRNIFDNIRKFIQFQLSVNISAVLLVFVTSCIGSESPISPIQMLWLNLIMDSLGSLALATESPSDELLYRKPYSRREYIVNHKMWKHIISQSIVQFSMIFFLYIFAEQFIIEEHPIRIEATRQLENCFGDFSAEIIKYQKSSMIYYIVDGKKSSWNAMTLIKPNLDPSYCMFYNKKLYPQQNIRNLEDAYKWWISSFGNTTHMTIIFNCFVLYSLCNQINARILDDSLNILKRIKHSLLFVFVFIVELSVQILMVQYGGLAFKCTIGGLTHIQWTICFAFASVSFWVSIFVKFLPLEKLGRRKKHESKRKVIEMKEGLIYNEN